MAYDESKFKIFNELLEPSEAEIVVIHHPEVLGDNYEELVENLNRMADAKMNLSIVPRKDRDVDQTEFLEWKI